jgi:hypothetical protein
LTRRRPGRNQARANSTGTSSPAAINIRSRGNRSPVSRFITAGGRQAKLTSRSRINAANRGGDSRTSLEATTARAPDSNAVNMSITDTSKFSDAYCNTRSAGPTCHCRTIPSAWLTTCRCSTTTPFGRPVEPDV